MDDALFMQVRFERDLDSRKAGRGVDASCREVNGRIAKSGKVFASHLLTRVVVEDNRDALPSEQASPGSSSPTASAAESVLHEGGEPFARVAPILCDRHLSRLVVARPGMH